MIRHLKTLVLGAALVCILAPWGANAQSRDVVPSQELRDLGITEIRHDRANVPELLRGNLGRIRPERAERDIKDVLSRLKPALRTTGAEDFSIRTTDEDEVGRSYYLTQTLHGLPVRGSKLVLEADSNTGELMTMTGKYLPADDLPTETLLSSEEAFERVPKQVEARLGQADREFEQLKAPELLYTFDIGGHGHLVWSFAVSVRSETAPAQMLEVVVNATRGSNVYIDPLTNPAKDRGVYDQGNLETPFQGVLLMNEANPTSFDDVAEAAFANAGDVYDFWSAKLGRDSYDNNGSHIEMRIHFGTNYLNAFWSRLDDYMVFGDGDGLNFEDYAADRDVVAHEMMHGLIHSEVFLLGQLEQGAIQEGLSDINAAWVEHWADGSSSEWWKFGDVAYLSDIQSWRRLDNPKISAGSGVDWYPDRHAYDILGTKIHENGSMVSLAFYLMSKGGEHPRAGQGDIPHIQVPNIGFNNARKIFVKALRKYVKFGETMHQLRDHTVAAANDIFGVGSSKPAGVSLAWQAVGIGNFNPPPILDEVDVESENCFGFVNVSWPTSASADYYELQEATVSNFSDAIWVHAGTQASCGLNVPGTGNRWYRARACSFASGCNDTWEEGDQVFTIRTYCL